MKALPSHVQRYAPALPDALATSRFCATALLPLHFQPEQNTRIQFRAGGRVRELGKASLIGMWSEGDYSAHRSAEPVEDEALLSLCLQGSMKLHASRRFCAHRGQWFLARTSDYQCLEAHQPVTTLTLRFPWEWLEQMAPVLILPQHRENPINTSPGLSQCLQQLLLSYWQNAEHLHPQDSLSMVASALSLASGHVKQSAGELPKVETPSLSAERHLRRLRATLERWLTQRPLTPTHLAAELGLSLRGLQSALTHCNTSLSAEIRTARLMKASELITQNPQHRRTLTNIALDLGYTDLATFSRQFKQHFGLPPSQYQRSRQSCGI